MPKRKRAKTPNQARHELVELLQREEFTPQQIKLKEQLEKLAMKDVPLLQHWIRSSSGPPRNGWTPSRWKKFHQQVKMKKRSIDQPVFRGTKMPWVIGKPKKQYETKQQFDDAIQKSLIEFDQNIPIKLAKTLSWTKSPTLAHKFASEAKGYEIVPGFVLSEGFIHVIRPPFKGVDVEVSLSKTKLKFMGDGTDEMEVANREQEVLLPIGTILVPVCREGDNFEWQVKL